MKIIDLSVIINEETPVYPGDPQTIITAAGVLSKDGFNNHLISIGTHAGTHIDAPMHMLKDGRSLDTFPAEHFIGKGRLVEVSNGGFDNIKSAGIQGGDIVLFCTGMSGKYHEPAYFNNYSAMSEEVAQYLVDTKVKMVGIDACSVDNRDSFPIHKTLLANDILIVENLTNLDQLADKEFLIYALPIKLQIDGAPARVIAQIT